MIRKGISFRRQRTVVLCPSGTPNPSEPEPPQGTP